MADTPAAKAAKARYEEKRKNSMTSIRISKSTRDALSTRAKTEKCGSMEALLLKLLVNSIDKLD